MVVFKDELRRSIARWGVRVMRIEFYSVRLASPDELKKFKLQGIEFENYIN